MSYDIAFWRYTETLEHDHAEVMASLACGSTVEGLALIETDAMVARLAELLSGWDRVDERTWENANRYVQASTSPQHLSLSMSFASARPILLKVATPMRRFGCGLWNPQTNQRLSGYDEAVEQGGR